MQNRMKTHSLTTEQINSLLQKAAVGSIATLDSDGAPYITPVHYVYCDNKIYIHGKRKGQKVDNILRNKIISFSVFEMKSLLIKENGNACNVNTEYESVIIKGSANITDDFEKKLRVLKEFVNKYTPQLSERQMPSVSINVTGVIEITIESITGKYYR